MKLKNARASIDRLDKQLVQILARRFVVSREIKKIKQEMGKAIVDRGREKEVMLRLKLHAKTYSVPFRLLQKVFRPILKESILLQKEN